jgi:hypothetical protein
MNFPGVASAVVSASSETNATHRRFRPGPVLINGEQRRQSNHISIGSRRRKTDSNYLILNSATCGSTQRRPELECPAKRSRPRIDQRHGPLGVSIFVWSRQPLCQCYQDPPYGELMTQPVEVVDPVYKVALRGTLLPIKGTNEPNATADQ